MRWQTLVIHFLRMEAARARAGPAARDPGRGRAPFPPHAPGAYRVPGGSAPAPRSHRDHPPPGELSFSPCHLLRTWWSCPPSTAPRARGSDATWLATPPAGFWWGKGDEMRAVTQNPNATLDIHVDASVTAPGSNRTAVLLFTAKSHDKIGERRCEGCEGWGRGQGGTV